MEYRANAALVRIADGVEDEPLARIEADPKTPLLPAHFVTAHGKAGPLRLVDLERLDVLSHRADLVRRVLTGSGRDGDDAMILDALDLHGEQIDDGDDVLDRVCVSIAVRTAPHPGEGPQQAPATFRFIAIVASRPGIDDHQIEVGDAALADRRLKVRIRFDDPLALEELLEGNRRLHARDVPPAA